MARATTLPFIPHRPTEGTPPEKAKGRGARSNHSGRYEQHSSEAFDDGWGTHEEVPPLRTHITVEQPRKIITFNKSPYVGFDRSINPYRGCEHGCIYCFARPTHAYMGLSAGLDFESRLFAKPDAPKLLAKELANNKYRPRPIAIGTNTDPYQPIERKFRIMRGLLSVFDAFNHPVTILTKSALIARDIDYLAPMAERNLTRAMLSITTFDRALARSMEPRAAAPTRRLETIKKLADAGIPVGIMTGPMIPGLNDQEMETILEAGAKAGATFAAHTIIRLPLEISPLFQEWLEAFAPNRAARIMGHIRDNNGGRDYDVDWSRGDGPRGPYARLISERYHLALKRFGLDQGVPKLDVSRFGPPSSAAPQLSLFDESTKT